MCLFLCCLQFDSWWKQQTLLYRSNFAWLNLTARYSIIINRLCQRKNTRVFIRARDHLCFFCLGSEVQPLPAERAGADNKLQDSGLKQLWDFSEENTLRIARLIYIFTWAMIETVTLARSELALLSICTQSRNWTLAKFALNVQWIV